MLLARCLPCHRAVTSNQLEGHITLWHPEHRNMTGLQVISPNWRRVRAIYCTSPRRASRRRRSHPHKLGKGERAHLQRIEALESDVENVLRNSISC